MVDSRSAVPSPSARVFIPFPTECQDVEYGAPNLSTFQLRRGEYNRRLKLIHKGPVNSEPSRFSFINSLRMGTRIFRPVKEETLLIANPVVI